MTAARHLAWVYGATLLWFLVAPTFPELAGADAATLAAGIPALTLLAACALR